MEFVAQEQQISAKQWERKKQLQNILRWILIEGYFVKTIEEVIGANPTLKKTKIQQEPTKAEIEVGCCSRNKDVLTNQKLSHLDSIEQRIVFTLKEKKKKEQRNKKSDLEPTTDVYVST